MVKGIPTPYRYSRRHSRFRPVHRSSRCGFSPGGTLLYHFRINLKSAISVHCLSPGESSVRGHSTSELLRTL